jgi:acetyl esterase/lipase
MRNRRPALGAATLCFLGYAAAAWAQGFPNVRQIPAPEEPDAIPLAAADTAAGSTATEIWETAGPDGRSVRNVTRPTLTPYLPTDDKATGTAMIVAPGGAFLTLSIDNEGHRVAAWLAARGVAAFVLKYRVNPTAPDPKEYADQMMATLRSVTGPDAPAPESPAPAVADGRAAIRMVRSRAGEWGIDPSRVGFMGFSAGGMLTISMGLLADPAARPDFIAPIYPPMSHRTVPADAPPLFAAIAADDPLFGGGQFDLVHDWLAARRPAELHVFERGGHGFGMRPQQTTSDHWMDELLWWMQARGYLGPK